MEGRALIKEVTKKPMATLSRLQRVLCEERSTFQDHSLCSIWADGSSFNRTRYQRSGSGQLLWMLRWEAQTLIRVNITENLKMAAHRQFPSSPMEPMRRCKEEWAKRPQDRRARLVASYSERLEAVIVLCWAKAVNIYVHVISQFLNKAMT